MIFFLILGILLGIVSVVFVAQNTTIVTVTFLTWQLQGSLALILFLAIITGALMILLILLPSFIKDVFSLASLRRQKRKLEEELTATKQTLTEAPAPAPAPVPQPEVPASTI